MKPSRISSPESAHARASGEIGKGARRYAVRDCSANGFWVIYSRADEVRVRSTRTCLPEEETVRVWVLATSRTLWGSEIDCVPYCLGTASVHLDEILGTPSLHFGLLL